MRRTALGAFLFAEGYPGKRINTGVHFSGSRQRAISKLRLLPAMSHAAGAVAIAAQ